MNNVNSWGDSPVVDEIRRLVLGPSGPVLKKAALKWTVAHKEALESHRTSGTEQPSLPWPMKERDLNFETGCAVLIAIYHQANRGYDRLFEPRNDDIVGGAVWLLLEESVCKWPQEFPVSEILAFVQAKLPNRGVLPTGEGESAPSTVVQGIPASGGNGQHAAGADGQPQEAAGDLSAQAQDGGEGWTWQAVRDELEARRQRGDKYTSHARLAEAITCKKWLVTKAFKNGSAELQKWASAKHSGASRRNLTPEAAAMAISNTPQGRERNPADIIEQPDIERALAYMIEQAGPDERARIHGLTAAEKRELAELALHDPDTEEQALRYRMKPG